MSSSSKVTPSDLASRVAYDFVVSPVANPGIVNAWMSERGRPSRSIAFAVTISAWVESRPPLTPMIAFGWPMAVQPLLEPGDLDVVGLVAVERQPLRVVRHEREPVHLAPQPDVAGGRVELELDGPERRDPLVVRTAVVVVGALPEPVLAELAEVDVGDGADRPLGEPRPLGHQLAALVDHGLAVPAQVGRRLPLPGGREDVRRVAARARAADQQPAVLGAGHRDRAAGEVGQHRRAGEGRLRARRHRHPHVLADLDVQLEVGLVGGGEDQVGAERHLGPARPRWWRRAGRRPARTGGARRTRGRSAGTTSPRRRGAGPCGSRPHS